MSGIYPSRGLLRTIAYTFARKTKINKPTEPILPKLEPEEAHELAEEFQPLDPKGVERVQDQVRKKLLKQLSYEGEDPTPNKLVNRPAKGVVWGLGGQLVLASRKMQLMGIKQEPEEIIRFLELHQVKNIYIHDWFASEQKQINKRRYSIIGSCFSAKHCWRTGLELKNAFNKNILHQKRNKKNINITALHIGSKADEWSIVEYKDFEISLMTEEQRQAVDLQWKWNNPVDEEIVERHSLMDNNKKKRKGQFEDFD